MKHYGIGLDGVGEEEEERGRGGKGFKVVVIGCD